MRIFTLIFLSLLSSLFSAKAHYFRSYKVEDGLSHNSVWAVMQDSHGFMWFGTNDGLNRFSGKNFKVYKRLPSNPASIGNNFIHCLTEDSKGRFFVGTKQGLYLFALETEEFSAVDLGEAVSVNAVTEDTDGNIYVATHGQGVFLLNADLSASRHFTPKNSNLPTGYVWTIAQDHFGGVWLGTVGSGLIFFNRQDETFTPIPSEKEFGAVYSIFANRDNLWLGLGEGLGRYNFRTKKLVRYATPRLQNVKSIIEFSDHELIMGSDRGLVVFDRTTETFDLLNASSSFDNLTDKSIFAIARDREGAFWIGTYFGGVNYFSPAINSFAYFYSTPEGEQTKNIVSSFAEDADGKIYVATHNDGLSVFNPQTSRFERQAYNLDYHNIQTLLLDDKKLYAGFYGKGIAVLNAQQGRITGGAELKALNAVSVTYIYKTAKGDVLFCCEDGTRALSADGEVSALSYLANKPVKCVIEDLSGALWFATHAGGLLHVSADGKQTWFANDPNNPRSLPSNNVNCVFQDSKFRVWAGTEGEGLAMFNPKTGGFETIYNEASGLPSNIIYSILDDAEGNVWASTAGGLVRIADNHVSTFGFISSFERIGYNANCALRTRDNRLYFGGTNGFIVFDPKEIIVNNAKPAVAITDFQVAGKPLAAWRNGGNVGKKIALKHSQSTFSFDFVALSYLSPAQNRYEYMLEGFNREWIKSTENRASYMNIPRGSYTFRVRGTNNDGVWSDTAELRVRVKPAFGLSPLMITFYFLLAAGVAYYLLLQYKRRLDVKNREKLVKVQADKEKEIYEAKIEFFTNIAHEIRTPLSLIAAPLETILASGDGTKQTRRNLEVIERNANRLLQLINQLLDFRKIEEDMFHFSFRRQNVVQIAREVYSQYRQNAEMAGIQMELVAEQESIECRVDREATYKIVSNLISNAMKYAKEKITVSVYRHRSESPDLPEQAAGGEGELLAISVADDGAGMEDAYLQRIFEPFFQVHDKSNGVKTGSGLGLPLSQSLAEKHGGKITVQSELGKGSVFTLTIPLVAGEEEEAEVPLSPPHREKKKSAREREEDELKTSLLIVEDNAELRQFLANALEKIYSVYQAENGVKALETVEKENIDIILSDIIMPEMDGLELSNRLKNDPATSYIPIILLSAKTDTQTKIEGLKKGADAYLEKPFSVEQLKAQISSIVENRDRMRANFRKSPLDYFRKNRETNDNSEFIGKLNKLILDNMLNKDFSINNLSEQFFMSRSSFHKKIKGVTGVTPNDYIRSVQLTKAAEMLASGKYKINEVCYMVGFNTPSYFSKMFYEQFGKLPKEFVSE
ncbi:MAG: response regulator [Prevotellaceae bacterium]|nr:response regulator [Prevotellaceae bacterium]